MVNIALFTANHQQKLEKGKLTDSSLRRRLGSPVYKNKKSTQQQNRLPV